MYQKKHHQQQACTTAVYSYICRVFLGGGWDLALYCTYVPRVCRVIPCPILLVRASCIACHGRTAQQQSAFTLEYIVPYCRCVRDVPTLKMRVVLFLVCIKNSTISSKNDHCCRLYSYKWRVFFFWVGILPFFFSLLYVRTSCVSRHPVSYQVYC